MLKKIKVHKEQIINNLIVLTYILSIIIAILYSINKGY
jgi:hypothetical protein